MIGFIARAFSAETVPRKHGHSLVLSVQSSVYRGFFERPVLCSWVKHAESEHAESIYVSSVFGVGTRPQVGCQHLCLGEAILSLG